MEPVEPLTLKGKREPVPAFRLVAGGEAPERVHGDVFVGREHELGEIASAWARAGAEQRCELVTVVAPKQASGRPGWPQKRLLVSMRGWFVAAVCRTGKESRTGRWSRSSSSSVRDRRTRRLQRRSRRCSAGGVRNERGGDRVGVPEAG